MARPTLDENKDQVKLTQMEKKTRKPFGNRLDMKKYVVTEL